ncbi:MAG: ABC transporter permease [Chloroflexi bacterium]|nr:ABC transporter permease [Chloroflexota bacterium]MCI0578754.1 ABC transporter permease [Chloroflexota bacterium]MCI0643961.1 ABC transporter permease [Chloroflexota bacterium]MCI0729573.1 ABC transporter permease [Chloroflexota bacterium]
MNLRENVRIAWHSLAANKLRAALTMLGIMIGVAAVITLLSIGDGVNRYVADQFIGLGTNLVFVFPNDDPSQTESSLTINDAEALADVTLVPGAVAVAPVYFRGADLQYGGRLYRTTLRASTPELGPLRGYEAARGRFLNDSDYNGRSRVVVLGPEVVKSLFPEDVDPLGADIKIRGITFRVVGILAEKGAGVFGSQDDLAVVPLTTAQERLFNTRSQRTGRFLVDMILVQAVNSRAVEDVVIDTSNVLRQTHGITFRDEDDFLILTQQDFLSTFGEVTGVLTLFLGAIASISLLVGGIGIMNIMLVSVTERTREIGLRKAVGARRRDILSQFLTEAVVLALLGGFLGIVLGFLGAAAVHLAVPDLDTSVTADSVLLAVGFSAVVGLFFGIYPASRAAGLHPIDALRFE